MLGDTPRAAVAVFVLCADTEEKAEELGAVLDFTLLAGEQGIPLEGVPSYEAVRKIRILLMNRDELLIIEIE